MMILDWPKEWFLVIALILYLVLAVFLLAYMVVRRRRRNSEIQYRAEMQQVFDNYAQVERAMEKRFWWYRSGFLKRKKREDGRN